MEINDAIIKMFISREIPLQIAYLVNRFVFTRRLFRTLVYNRPLASSVGDRPADKWTFSGRMVYLGVSYFQC